MQPASTNTKQLKNHSHTIWLLTCLLTVFVIATAAVLGMCLYIYANPSDSKISLYKGELSEDNNKIIKTGTTNHKTSSKTYTGNKAKQQAKKYGFDVKDADQVWTTDTAIELFKVSYKNANGEITVKSAGNDKVLAPGTDGSYTFDLKNTAKKAANYKVWVDAKINSNITGMPLQTKMSGQNGWLLGNNDTWKDAKALDGITTTEHIEAGKSAEYKIYWQWPFEQGMDEEDTNLGNITVGQEFTYIVMIHTLATEANPSDTTKLIDHKTPVSALTAIKTGDTATIMKWAVILALSAGIIFILLLRKKKQEDEENQA